jgi:hypothetical protein
VFSTWDPLPGTDDAGAGQPRPVEEDPRQPTAAERVRTLVESRVSAAPGVPGVELDELGSAVPESRTVSTGGEMAVLVPAGSSAARAAAHSQDDGLSSVRNITGGAGPGSAAYPRPGRAAGRPTPVRGGGYRSSDGVPPRSLALTRSTTSAYRASAPYRVGS